VALDVPAILVPGLPPGPFQFVSTAIHASDWYLRKKVLPWKGHLRGRGELLEFYYPWTRKEVDQLLSLRRSHVSA
jgi:hypothetical protein